MKTKNKSRTWKSLFILLFLFSKVSYSSGGVEEEELQVYSFSFCPTYVWERVYQYLDFKDIRNLLLTCKHLKKSSEGLKWWAKMALTYAEVKKSYEGLPLVVNIVERAAFRGGAITTHISKNIPLDSEKVREVLWSFRDKKEDYSKLDVLFQMSDTLHGESISLYSPANVALGRHFLAIVKNELIENLTLENTDINELREIILKVGKRNFKNILEDKSEKWQTGEETNFAQLIKALSLLRKMHFTGCTHDCLHTEYCASSGMDYDRAMRIFQSQVAKREEGGRKK